MSNLGPQFIKDSYQNLVQLTSSNALQKGDGTSISNISVTSSWAINALTASFVNTGSTNAFVQGGNSFGTTALLGTNDTQDLQLETSGSVRMTISSSGNVGIGTTTPVHNLVVNGNTGVSINANGAIFPNIHRDSADGGMLLRSWNGSTFTNNVKITPTTEVGIGTTSPTAELHVSGASADALLRVGSPTNANILLVSGSGFIGVNRIPGVELDVTGNIRASSTMFNSVTQTNNIQLSSAFLRFLSASVETARYDNNGWGFFNTAPTAKVHISGANADNLFRVSSPSATNALFVSGSGRVGIGTTTPRELLHVAGGNIALDASRYIDWGSGNSRITDLGSISGQGYPITISTFGPIAAGAPNNLTEKLRLTGSGSLGLGTTDPLARLHVSGSDGNDFFRITSGSQNILNIRSGSAVFFAGTGVAPTANFDLDVQGTGTAFGGSVRIAGNGTAWAFASVASVNRGGTIQSDMFNITMGGTSPTAIQNPMKVEFNANQNATSGSGYTVLRVNATHATTAGTGSKLLQTWEFGGVQRSVVNITGSIGVGITAPSASVHISSSLGLPPMLTITPHSPLPTTNIPTGTFMVSASVPPRPYMWDGTSWYAL